MYILRIDHVRYDHDPRHPVVVPLTLVSAMRLAYGCANAHIERADGTTVVAHAGRAYSDLVHAPTGRVFRNVSGRRPGQPRATHPFTVVYSPWTPR